MRKLLIFSLVTLLITGCNISQQAKEIKTLTDCLYTIKSVDNIIVSGTDVNKIIEDRNFSMGSIPSLALGFLSKNIPLKADVTIEITNPTENFAAINYFDYELLLDEQVFTEGTVNQRINIGPNETTEVTLPLNTNVYKFLINDSVRANIQTFVNATQNQSEAKTIITLKIKPAIYVGEKIVKYPGFIDIKKELSNSLFYDIH